MNNPFYFRNLFLLLLLTPVAFGCDGGSPMSPGNEEPELPRALSPSESLLVKAGNGFSFDLLSYVFQSDPSENVFISPLSASMALGMTLNGAGGSTADQIRGTLGFGGLSLKEINQGYRDLLDLLEDLDPEVVLGMGNSVWTQTGFPIQPDFLTRAQQFFEAEVQELDLHQPDALDLINGWASEKTDGRIEAFLDEVGPATVALLLNTTYFQGTWTHRFPREATAPAEFSREDGVKETVQMMTRSDSFLYGENGLYQVVDLPYGMCAYSMTVFLPQLGHSVAEVVASLSSQSWAELPAMLSEVSGAISLPQFTMAWEGTLNQTLQSMGIVDAFEPGLADFSNLSQVPGLFVDEVLQKSWVSVDEDGTAAAAATSVDIKLGGTVQFRADRPFLFLIGERLTGTILFAGAFLAPIGA